MAKYEVNHGVHDAGKGSQPRAVNYQRYADNWEKIFGKKKVDNTENCDKIPEIEKPTSSPEVQGL